jgi:hypothetical protein
MLMNNGGVFAKVLTVYRTPQGQPVNLFYKY